MPKRQPGIASIELEVCLLALLALIPVIAFALFSWPVVVVASGPEEREIVSGRRLARIVNARIASPSPLPKAIDVIHVAKNVQLGSAALDSRPLARRDGADPIKEEALIWNHEGLRPVPIASGVRPSIRFRLALKSLGDAKSHHAIGYGGGSSAAVLGSHLDVNGNVSVWTDNWRLIRRAQNDDIFQSPLVGNVEIGTFGQLDGVRAGFSRIRGASGIEVLKEQQADLKAAYGRSDEYQPERVVRHSFRINRDASGRRGGFLLGVYGLLVVLAGFFASVGGWIWGRYDRPWLGGSLGVLGLATWIGFFALLLRGA